MTDARLNSFFCEDFRVEATGQPMFIGLFSPTLEVFDLPTEIPSLLLIHMFYISPKIRKFEAALTVSLENCAEEDEQNFPISAKRTFLRREDLINEDDWMVVTPLDLSGIILTDGLKISARLECLDISETTSLKVRMASEE